MNPIETIRYYLWEHCNVQSCVLELATSEYREKLLVEGCGQLHYTYEYEKEDTTILLGTEQKIGEQHTPIVQGMVNHLFLQMELETQAKSQQIMMESIQEISKANHEEEEVIQLILDRAFHVLKRAALGVIWMLEDVQTKVFKPIAWAGGLSNQISTLRFQQTEGILGNTIRYNHSVLLKSYLEIKNMSATISAENLNVLKNVYDYESAQSIISVPIRENGQVIGVIMMYQIGFTPRLTEGDVRILESFADQVSIVLTNTKMLANILKQNELLTQRDEIHRTFLHLTLEQKGFYAIAQECRKMIGLPVIVFDNLSQSFHESQPESMSAAVKDMFNNSLYNETTIVERGHKRYSIYPIAEKSISLGLLIVELNEEELTPIQNVVLEQAQTTVLLEHIRQQSLNEIMHQNAKARFDLLLSMKHIQDQKRTVSQMGMNLSEPLRILVIKVEDIVGEPISLYLQKIYVKLQQKMLHTLMHAHIYQTTITLIVKVADYDRFKMKLSNWLADYNDSAKWRVQCAVGCDILEYDQFEQSYSQALKVLDFIQKSQRWEVLDIQDVGLRSLFVHIEEIELDQFVNEIYGPLVLKDTDHVLVETMEAYINHLGAVKLVAKQLHIHPNTLYQRIEKIQSRTNLHFNNPNDYLKLHLACYLKQQI